jgi:Nucleoside-diphosphate-sugar epimerases
MRVAVTGATGFIGGRVARRLADAGHEVLGLGRRPAAVLTEPIRYVRWDVGDPADPPPLALRKVDAVVHAAAHVADWGPWEMFRRVTVEGTGRLIDACGDARLVVVGSASVYDPYRGHLAVREDEGPVDRYRNEYSRAKAAQERLIRRLRPDAVILRPHAVYGAGDQTLLPRLIAARRLGCLVLPAGGRCPMSITHVDTLVDVVLAALDRPEVRGPVNVADATPVRACDLLDATFAAMGLPTKIVPLPLPLAWTAAGIFEWSYRFARLPSPPPLTAYAVSHLAWPFVLDLGRLDEQLGIRPDRDYADHLADLARKRAIERVAQPLR